MSNNQKSLFSTKKLATMAIFAAISIILVMFLHFPIFPTVSFLEYDPADIPILLSTFMYGPVAGIIMTIVVSLIQGLTVSAGSGVYGIIMHIIATGAYVLVSGLIYKKYNTTNGLICSLVFGTVAMALVMIPANLFITPLFMGVTAEQVVNLLGFIIAFNAIKAGVNGVISFVVYKPMQRILK